MKYINKKTGAIVDSPSEIFGENWQELKEEKPRTVKKEKPRTEKETKGE